MVHILCGRLAATKGKSRSYLSIPLNLFRAADETGAPV